MQIIPLGDSALIVRVDESRGDAESTLDTVLDVLVRLEAAALPGVIELAPAYASVGVFYDPARVIGRDGLGAGAFAILEARIKAALAPPRPGGPTPAATAARSLEIPVCYEEEFAFDLREVARHASLSPDEVVQRHGAANYRVRCVGFTPGFPYLSGLPLELATPRRASPRKEVPAGSVAIGAGQTGIYPQSSPGGWNVIGRTPLRLFDARRDPPVLLQAGDEVRFRAITRADFEAVGK